MLYKQNTIYLNDMVKIDMALLVISKKAPQSL